MRGCDRCDAGYVKGRIPWQAQTGDSLADLGERLTAEAGYPERLRVGLAPGPEAEVDVRDELRAEQRLAIAALPGTAAYRPTMALIAASLAALISMAVCAAAIIVPAPVGAVPVVVVICFVCPLWAAREVPPAIASRRAKRAREGALASLRASLERLPDTEHPLGF